MNSRLYIFFLAIIVSAASCGKGGGDDPPPTPVSISFSSLRVNGANSSLTPFNVSRDPALKFIFSGPVKTSSVPNSVSFTDGNGTGISFTTSFENGDSAVVIRPSSSLASLSKYRIIIAITLQSSTGGSLTSPVDLNFTTQIDSTRKFPLLTDNELLDKVQQQTFKYFWDFGHPVSGLARERNTSGETVTSGGSGFGIMSIVTAIHRGFITRAQGLARMQTIVAFLKNTAQTFHGAYPHWLNGTTGAVIPFSTKDNGADLVETSYLIQGLLCARQYFNDAGAAETTLRNDINTISNRVEWSWFRNGGQDVLYWHWSPNYNWEMNLPIRGWNECLITYVLAASSTTYSIPASVYTSGWKGGSNFTNGNTYFGYQLPLGPNLGGPLFFSHYSFLGINPNGLTDPSANYATQTKNHTLINYNYCKANPRGWFGYSDSVWGLTASDIAGGYAASSPTNDISVIAPTAALSSFPYTPAESMAALKFFYYVLGDKLWKEYGFVDAFSLHNTWFANSFLAIDQGPIIIMIENYRSGLLWNLFTSCPEVKAGMLSLG
ncbi:MAG TPA: glucoamylase family protein, partial [Chitinophagaceae bacterium]